MTAAWLVVIALLGAALTGCASARLTLNLDLYAEDPTGTLVQLTPVRIADLDRALKGLARDVPQLAEDRRTLADELFKTFEAVTHAVYRAEHGASPTQVDPNVLKAQTYLERHKKYLSELAAAASQKITMAQEALDGYAQPSQKPASSLPGGTSPAVNELSALRAINEAANAVAKLAGPVNTEFERLLIRDWPTVAKSITPVNVELLGSTNAETPELIALREQVKRLADKARELRNRGRKIPETALTALDQAFKEGQLGSAQLKASFDKLILAATEVSVSQPGPDQLEALVKASGRTFNLVDRLQDPADPVWRIVSHPENEAKWRNTFSETSFYRADCSAVTKLLLGVPSAKLATDTRC